MNSKKSTLKNYTFVLTRFENYFGNIELTSITTDGILPFLTKISEGAKQSTKKLRYALISAFFNFIKTSYDSNLQNPCDSPVTWHADSKDIRPPSRYSMSGWFLIGTASTMLGKKGGLRGFESALVNRRRVHPACSTVPFFNQVRNAS